MQAEAIRSILPESERSKFDDIVCQRVLGASRHIAMIGGMMQAVARHAVQDRRTTGTMLETLAAVAQFFKETRGQASSAVSNAIDAMTQGFAALAGCPVEKAAEAVEQAVDGYETGARRGVDVLTGYAVSLCRNMDRILVFDYSSTVDLFLKKLGRATPGATVYIPESRVINGGYAFVPTALRAGLRVHFIPDAAIAYFLRQCNGAFIGAETFYPDGTAFNTTGSDMVGLACREYGVPLYVLTPLIKVDIRPCQGFVRDLVQTDPRERLRSAGFTPDELANVAFSCPELVAVTGDSIRAFVTEQGVIPPGALYGISLRYAKSLSGGND